MPTQAIYNIDIDNEYNVIYLSMSILRNYTRKNSSEFSAKKRVTSSIKTDDDADYAVIIDISNIFNYANEILHYETAYKTFIEKYEFQLEKQVEEILCHYEEISLYTNFRIILDIIAVLVEEYAVNV